MSVEKMESTASNTADEYSLAKKLVRIVAADFMCWVRDILSYLI